MEIQKIAILYNEPVAGSGADDWDVLDQVVAVENAMRKLEIPFKRLGIHSGFMQQVEDLSNEGIRRVFNLVEAIGNKGELNYFVPALLNLKKIAYTGNPLEALFITTSKRLTKQILQQNGIPVPLELKPSDWKQMIPGTRYILKPVWEDGSAGITGESVFTFNGLPTALVSNANDPYWMIEEFIDGREFNISVLSGETGPEILPLAEMTFRDFGPHRPRIVDYNAKWKEGSFEYENTIRVFPDLSDNPQLFNKLIQATRDTWNCLGLNGYARVDVRVDKSGNVFVLEANANPCISPGSGFAAASEKAGYSFTEVVGRMLDHMNNANLI